jgi:hypothetical protein
VKALLASVTCLVLVLVQWVHNTLGKETSLKRIIPAAVLKFDASYCNAGDALQLHLLHTLTFDGHSFSQDSCQNSRQESVLSHPRLAFIDSSRSAILTEF